MSSSKQIAFLCHPYHRGGVTRWMADAAMAYADAGWQVYFVTVQPKVVFLSGRGRETMIGLLHKRATAVQVISAQVGREFELGTPEYRAYIYMRLLSRVPVGTPVILSDDSAVWSAACQMHRSYQLIGVLHSDDEHYYRHATHYYDKVTTLVCVSGRVKRIAMQRVPQIKEDKIHVIPCGIHLPKVNQQPVNDTSLLRLAYVGRITEYQKRVTDLAAVCKILDEMQVGFHMDIVGDGVDRAMLEQKFKDAGVMRRATFHGWLSQEKVAERLSATDIMLLTSDFEGTPISMMEALAAGCGFAGTRVSGIEDYEHHALAPGCLVVFAVGDAAEAAGKISNLSAVPAAKRRQAARQLAEAEFSMKICLDRYNRVLANLPPATAPIAPIGFPLYRQIYAHVLATARYLKSKITS